MYLYFTKFIFAAIGWLLLAALPISYSSAPSLQTSLFGANAQDAPCGDDQFWCWYLEVTDRADRPKGGYKHFAARMAAFRNLLDDRGDRFFDMEIAAYAATSPCQGAFDYLNDNFTTGLVDSLDVINNNFMTPPEAYGYTQNPWQADNGYALYQDIISTFTDWCVFLPDIQGDQDNGLEYIQLFAWFYYQNPTAQSLVQGDIQIPGGPVFANFLLAFNQERGEYMNSSDSTEKVASWIADPRVEIQDYQRQSADQYVSWNDFFTRNLTRNADGTIPSRPITMPERDYVIVSPTDCIMNPLVQYLVEDREDSSDSNYLRSVISNPLQENSVIDVKGYPISLRNMFGTDAWNSWGEYFIGGTGLSCVLMPNTYHHFHSPVSGVVQYSEVLTSGTYGYFDWPNWVPSTGVVGRPGTDFSQFEVFQRGLIIVRSDFTAYDGSTNSVYAALIPVGLDTIGSVELNRQQPNDYVVKGESDLGYFQYGGSLFIMLFSKTFDSSGNITDQPSVTAAVQTRLGNQIGYFDTGSVSDTLIDNPGRGTD